jgi:hypothetical protein
MNGRFHAAFGALATLAVVLVIAWGFVLVGSPGARRTERFDEQRLHDLQAIAREIHSLTVSNDEPPTLKQPLPQSLAELAAKARVEKLKLHDPETGRAYRYTVKSERIFELCAEFTQDRDADQSVFWNHPVGEHCFTIDVLDPPPFY